MRFAPIGVLLFVLGFVVGLLVCGGKNRIVEVSYPRGSQLSRGGRPLRIGDRILVSYRDDEVWHERLSHSHALAARSSIFEKRNEASAARDKTSLPQVETENFVCKRIE